MTDEQQQTEEAALADKPANGEPGAALAPVEDFISSDTIGVFSSGGNFSAALRMAKLLAASTLVPTAYQNSIPNSMIAMEIASRIGISVFAAMQNLDIIHQRPGWSSKFLIATVNASGRFTPLRYEWKSEQGKAGWGCRAWAKDKADGERCVGTWVTWEMAEAEGWTKKSGSKWKTMPDQMFCYRAAAFWTRVYCPEIGLGFHTSEELQDIHGGIAVVRDDMPAQLTPGTAQSLESSLGVRRPAEVIDAVVDDTDKPTGEAEQQTLLDEAQP